MNENKTKVINLFGGPGCGKSTTRAGLFFLMKWDGQKVEEVTEYAKDLTWEGNDYLLTDQLHILGNQNRRMARLQGKRDTIITDSPLILGINYVTADYLPNTFKSLMFELWDTYDNYNYFLIRDKVYDPVGRKQTEQEAVEKDAEIKEMLLNNGIPFTEVNSDKQAPSSILLHFKYGGVIR
jgi:hypothetical protein